MSAITLWFKYPNTVAKTHDLLLLRNISYTAFQMHSAGQVYFSSTTDKKLANIGNYMV